MWPQSCFINGHNTVCGEREYRGERRRKDGRSLLATAAPSFFVLVMLMCAVPVGAQRIDVVLRGGVSASTSLVEEQVAAPTIEQIIGAPVDDRVRAVPAPAPNVGVVVRAGFWPNAWVEAGADYARGVLNADEDGRTRRMQDLGVLQGTLGVSWAVRPSIELGASAGLLRYDTEERGLFAGGTGNMGTLGVRVGWTPSLLSGRLSLDAGALTHRFGTTAIRQAGGIDGNVLRFSLNARVRIVEVGR